MSSLRRSAMKRALRQSSGHYQDFQKDTIVAESAKADITDASGLSSSNTSRTRNKRSEKKRKNNSKIRSPKEKGSPVAQSTMIEQNITIETSNVTDTIDKGGIQKVKKDSINQKDTKDSCDKISSQEAADMLFEYQYKYGRLNTILEDFKNEQAILLAERQKQQEISKDSKARLNNQLYSLESEKFNMEEEFQKLKKENEELRSKLSKYETETTKSQSEQKLTTPTANDTLNLSRLTSSGKEKLSRSRRKSILSESINAIAKDGDSKIELYENIILDQEDIMDFYSLLAGTSIWKPRPTEEESGKENGNNDKEEDLVEMRYPCKIQLQNDLEGYEFEMTLNIETHQLSYIPPESLKNGPYYEKLPDLLKDRASYAADNACLFVKELSKTICSGS